MTGRDPEMLEEFLSEVKEHLTTAEEDALALGQSGEGIREDRVHRLFRSLHTIKGGAALMEFGVISKFAHALEDVAGKLRARELRPDSHVAEVLLKGLDKLKLLIAHLDDDSIPVEEELALVRSLLEASAGPAQGGKVVPGVRALAPAPARVVPAPGSIAGVAAQILGRVRGEAGGELAPAEREVQPAAPAVKSAPAAAPSVRTPATGLGIAPAAIQVRPPALASPPVQIRATSPPEPGGDAGREDRVDGTPQPASAGKAAAASPATEQQAIRVRVEKLDDLIALVGELVIAESMVTRHPAVVSLDDERLAKAIHQLRRVSSYLQDVAMSTRMIPLTATFRRMVRVLHDTARKTDKKAQLVLRGEDTEVDKNVIELIADPLVHIVRNAIDHGIEAPQERQSRGKPETGTVIIEGRHEGGEVWITIRDDGAGLNRERLLQRGIERGLVKGTGRDLSDQQVFRLIFAPGLSTSDEVSDLSGRGVGMDVVRANIEKLKGRVDVHSRFGEGTTVVLRIPLTLAIIDGMLVRVARAQYTIPLLAIRECFRPEPGQVTRTPDGQDVVRLRDEFIPVLHLHKLFGKTPVPESLHHGILVVVEDNRQPVCLLVDEIVGQQQTVIKGLSDYLGDARAISGCTILGDGQVSLILDVRGLVEMATAAASVSCGQGVVGSVRG